MNSKANFKVNSKVNNKVDNKIQVCSSLCPLLRLAPFTSFPSLSLLLLLLLYVTSLLGRKRMNEETPTPADNAPCQATAADKNKAPDKSKGY
jgi:hypothetical protein